jgi:double-stranded uracil-DNA glycosylase
MTLMIYCFPPIADQYAEILILGSMPGSASLDANQYYAHPQNAFWRIMGELLGFDPAVASYAEKTGALKSARIALWDVLHSCKRKGSLDSSIENGSQRVNDFRMFFTQYTQIRQVFFNGAKAEACFRRDVLNKQIADLQQMRLTRLPSTSPAHATVSFMQKRDQWLELLGSKLVLRCCNNSILSV